MRLRNESLARLRSNAPPNIRLIIDNQNLVHKTRIVVAPSLQTKPACGQGNSVSRRTKKPHLNDPNPHQYPAKTTPQSQNKAIFSKTKPMRFYESRVS
jgi:hypothetical protein